MPPDTGRPSGGYVRIDCGLTCSCCWYGTSALPTSTWDLATDPPAPSVAWPDAHTCTFSLSITDWFGIEWAPRIPSHAVHTLQASEARIKAHVRVHRVPTWPERTQVDSTVMTVAWDVTLEHPYIQHVAQSTTMTVCVDTQDEAYAWDWLELECEPALARLAYAARPSCDSDEVEWAPVSSSSLTIPETWTDPVPLSSECALTLYVDVAAACGTFGCAPTHPMTFQVRGQYRLSEPVGTWPFPVLQLAAVPAASQRTTYIIEQEGVADTSYALDVHDMTLSPPRVLRVDAPLVWSHTSARLAWTRTTRSATAPTLSETSRPILSVHQEVWPFVDEGYVQHRIDMKLGPGTTGRGVVCWFSDKPMGLDVLWQGQSLPHEMVPDLLATTHTASTASAAPCMHALHMAWPPDPRTMLTLQYTTPWVGYEGHVSMPCFASALPMITLRAHGYEDCRPCIEADAHRTYHDATLVTWFHVRPYTSLTVPLRLVSERTSTAPRAWTNAVFLASLALAFIATCWAYMAHTTSQRLVVHVDALAMALDIDLSDGVWMDAPEPVPHTWPLWTWHLERWLARGMRRLAM